MLAKGASVWPSSLTIHYFSSSSTLSPSVLQARKQRSPFVWTLIRKTLTWKSHPLFFLILVGKYFIDFCSNRRRVEMRGALCGIRLCGRFPGWGELWGGMCMSVYVEWVVMPLLINLIKRLPLNLRMNQLWLWSSSHHNCCHSLLSTCCTTADFAASLLLLLW